MDPGLCARESPGALAISGLRDSPLRETCRFSTDRIAIQSTCGCRWAGISLAFRLISLETGNACVLFCLCVHDSKKELICHTS